MAIPDSAIHTLCQPESIARRPQPARLIQDQPMQRQLRSPDNKSQWQPKTAHFRGGFYGPDVPKSFLSSPVGLNAGSVATGGQPNRRGAVCKTHGFGSVPERAHAA